MELNPMRICCRVSWDGCHAIIGLNGTETFSADVETVEGEVSWELDAMPLAAALSLGHALRFRYSLGFAKIFQLFRVLQCLHKLKFYSP